MPNVRVADVDLSLTLPPGNWDYLFPPAKGRVKGSLDFYYEKNLWHIMNLILMYVTKR